jgi:hypothetical protein
MMGLVFLALTLLGLMAFAPEHVGKVTTVVVAALAFPVATFGAGTLAWLVVPWSSPMSWWVCCLVVGVPVGGLASWSLSRLVKEQ